MSAGTGCCFKWLNINHELDPVGQFLPFNCKKDAGWLDPRIDAHGYHRDITLHRVSNAAIHSINHYFRDPSFHIPFFELTFGRPFPKRTREKAIDEFEQSTPEGQFKALKPHLETCAVSDTASFRRFYESLKAFIAVVKQFSRSGDAG